MSNCHYCEEGCDTAMAEEQIIYRNRVPRYTVKRVIDDDGNEKYQCVFIVPDGIDPKAYGARIRKELDRALPELLAQTGQYMLHGLVLDDPFPLSPKRHPANGVPTERSDCIWECFNIDEDNVDFSTPNPYLGEKNT